MPGSEKPDEIDEAMRDWARSRNAASLPFEASPGFRAGYVAALRRAEGIVQAAKKRVMPASAEMVVADIAAALASLSPAPPRPETKRGEGHAD